MSKSKKIIKATAGFVKNKSIVIREFLGKSTIVMKEFLSSQASAGIILFIFAVFAALIANSGYYDIYKSFFAFQIPIDIPVLDIYKKMDLKLWIDDGFMAIFFLLVGLELKREVSIGELSSKAKVSLPLFAAIGGVIFPMAIYWFFNHSDPAAIRGVAIPAATDIAFAVGILSLFGNRISYSLKIFLVALAIIDDLIAILIIAIFYTEELHTNFLLLAGITMVILFGLNRARISSLIPYLLLAPILWLFVLKSGIHATIAGVALAMFIPLSRDKAVSSPAKKLEHFLHMPVAYLILPIFAFANSGVVFDGFSIDTLLNKVVLGIILGLFIGKQLGIMLMAWLLYKMKICKFMDNIRWLEFYGVAVLTGVGFTMSLFIGNLAFSSEHMMDNVKIGVIFGSLFSAIYGSLILFIATRKKI
ncbi:MAG: NhaA family Na+:H+ antiporter [Lentimonas sp.]|jgi:NhaA family Na+:H+ antiporter